MRATRVRDIMSTRVVTVELDDRLEDVKRIFDSMRFRHLLVIEEGQLYGVVSDRDLLRALSPYIGSTVETPRDVATLNKRVHQVMSRKPITLREDATLGDAVDLFLNHHISCIPIVDAGFRPVGVVSWRDVIKKMAGPCDVNVAGSGQRE
jgi:acetoin utilization protein AcuB